MLMWENNRERTQQSNQHVHNLAFESMAVLWCMYSHLLLTLAFNDLISIP